MNAQLEIPQAKRPEIDKGYIAALARLSPTLAYQELRDNKRTVREAATLVADAVMCTNWMAMNTYFELHGVMPYVSCEFLGQEVDIFEQAESGEITQMIDDKRRLFMNCGEDFTYEPATMKKIRTRAIKLFEALALVHEGHKAKEQREIDKRIKSGGLPF